MIARIEQDHQRFRQIVKGKIRGDLRKFLSRRELIGREGKGLVSIPIHDIDTPTFRYGDNSQGVGMGEGPGEGGGETGGDEPGKHLLEVDVSLEELADILAEELKLPRIKPKGASRLTAVRDKYTSIRTVGPAALRSFKRTYKEALKRQVMLGQFDPDNPIVIPTKPDLRFRSWNEVKKPQNNAVIVYMMDVSGSMGDQQKELVRLEAFWIDTWLRRNYEGIDSRYIVHDVAAREVDKATFFSIREDGGTRISSAYHACKDLINQRYNPMEWNIYLFHFSDGDNSSEADNRASVKLLSDDLLPIANLFGYCQVTSAYGSGNFINVLHETIAGSQTSRGGRESDSNLVTSRVNSRDDIYDSLRTFFSAGK